LLLLSRGGGHGMPACVADWKRPSPGPGRAYRPYCAAPRDSRR
jgi:hypothetical protein